MEKYDSQNKKIGFFCYCKEEQKVLLHFRDGNTKYSPYQWDCFGGEIEDKETPDEALARELFEELRISIRAGEKRLILEKKGNKFYCIDFLFSRTGEIILGEGGGLGWISLKCALKMKEITKEAKKVLQEFINFKKNHETLNRQL